MTTVGIQSISAPISNDNNSRTKSIEATPALSNIVNNAELDTTDLENNFNKKLLNTKTDLLKHIDGLEKTITDLQTKVDLMQANIVNFVYSSQVELDNRENLNSPIEYEQEKVKLDDYTYESEFNQMLESDPETPGQRIILEDELRNIVTSNIHGNDGISINDLTCGVKLCRLSLTNSEGDVEKYVRSIEQNISWSNTMMSNMQINEDGNTELKLYLVRTGYDLPSL